MSAAALAPLVRALERRAFAIDDWGARATAGTVAWHRRDGEGVRTGEQAIGRYRAIVHRDVPAGRGSAVLELDAGASGELAGAVGDAVERALATIGPAWKSPPPAAPARVVVADPSIARPTELAEELARAIAAAAAAAGADLVAAEVEVVRQTITLATSRGLDAAWPETELTARVELARGGRRAVVTRRARQVADLDLAGAIAAALARADRAAAAGPTPVGRTQVVLDAGAGLHGGLGLLAAFAGQADPALERQGLVAARAGRPIAPGAAAAAEPLDLLSDGTLPFGLASAPIADVGDPVRRFALVERGLVRGLALDAREAALRGAQANGGVRGLVVAPGGATADLLLAGGPLLQVEALHWLELEPMTGRFRARIALGRVHGAGASRDVRGGLVRGDALAALALARRSREVTATPSYRGPARWAIGELLVDAS